MTTRQDSTFFNPARPLFVKIPFQSGAKQLKIGDRFNWNMYSVPIETVQILFKNDFVHHNEELEEEIVKSIKVGDGLEELTLEQLHILVANINGKVKEKTTTTKDFLNKKCPTSKIKDKQVGLIRRWRMSYGHFE